MKLVFGAVFLSFAVFVLAAELDEGGFPEYWANDYENYDYSDETNDERVDSKQEILPKQEDIDKQVETEIKEFRDQNEAENDSNDDAFDTLEDYQIEDNRLENSDKKVEIEPETDPSEDNNLLGESILEEEPKIESLDSVQTEQNDDSLAVLPLENNEQNVEEDNNNEEEAVLGDYMWGDIVEDELAPLPIPEEKKESLNDEENIVDDIENPVEDSAEKQEESNFDDIFKETNKILNENDGDFIDDSEDLDPNEEEKTFDELFADVLKKDETPDEVLGDLDDDLDALFNTLNKLTENNSDEHENLDEQNEEMNKNESNEVLDYEEKYNRPYKEENILSLRDDYENFDDNVSDNDNSKPEILTDIIETNELIKSTLDPSVLASEPIITNILQDNEATISPSNNESNDESFDSSKEIDKILSLHDNDKDDEYIDEIINQVLRHSYGNDGLVDDQMPINEDAEMILTPEESQEVSSSNERQSTTYNYDNNPYFRAPNARNFNGNTASVEYTTGFDNYQTSSINWNQPTETTEADDGETAYTEESTTADLPYTDNSQYTDLMFQFAIDHSEDLDASSENFDKNVPPIHISLKVGEPTVIESPDFPEVYPLNNVVDWIIDGPGFGIEVNITHLQVNGTAGDYLLIKPGGVDESGSDGLIFSYQLNSERRYRFTNVNRMFIRFEPKTSVQYYNGFSLSAKMIWPLPDLGRTEEPEAEAVIHPPRHTFIVNLAGVTMPNFAAVRPGLKELIADMAQRYIEDNEIDQGLNTTLEVTQITKTAVCNIRWPNYETCVEVTFGVPLHYDGDVEKPRLNSTDLGVMWATYINQEPFATRLRLMGITEYAVPNDHAVLMVWLAIALGVVVSMAMLAFALWRFRCFEDYTRMMAYSETDSVVKEKRNMDLFPAPHQALPPLYSESDYRWADDNDDSARVDIGGFSNKSYVRDDMFNFDSDEDERTPRNRNDVISPRNVYEV